MKSKDISSILDRLRWAYEQFLEGVGTYDAQDEDYEEIEEIRAHFKVLTNTIVKFCAKEETTI